MLTDEHDGFIFGWIRPLGVLGAEGAASIDKEYYVYADEDPEIRKEVRVRYLYTTHRTY